MGATTEDLIFKGKNRKHIQFDVQLNEEQKTAKDYILHNHITVLSGQAGSGKTLVAIQTGLDLLFNKVVEKIIIARPAVANSKEEHGFLPGDLKEKMDPWVAPIYHNLDIIYGKTEVKKNKIKKELELDNIEIVPFAFMRGRTFTNSFVIVDEAQNANQTQLELVLGRLGKNSWMVICGDTAQIDLPNKRHSGFAFLKTIEQELEVPGFKTFKLLQNNRHEIVQPILDIYKKYRD